MWWVGQENNPEETDGRAKNSWLKYGGQTTRTGREIDGKLRVDRPAQAGVPAYLPPFACGRRMLSGVVVRGGT